MVEQPRAQSSDDSRKTLFFKLGESDRIGFGQLLGLLSNIRLLLQDFDAALSHDPRGTVRWEVSVLQKESPVLLGLTGEPVRRRSVMPKSTAYGSPEVIEREMLSSTVSLSNRGERPAIVSDSAIERYRSLARSSRKIGDIQVFDDNTNAVINEVTLDNIRKLTGPKTRSVGSILGTLESISVHKSNEIRVWDENSSRPIRCRYPRALEETLKAALRSRVLVSGEVAYNTAGQPIFVEVSDVESYPSDADLPSIEEVMGSVDVTGDASLSDYMAHLRDE